MSCALFGIAFEEHFPLVRTLEYPPALLNTLSDVKVQVADELAVLESVQKNWENTMEAPEMDLVDLSEGQTIMRVNYRPEDWLLLSESIKLQSRVIDFMFQK